MDGGSWQTPPEKRNSDGSRDKVRSTLRYVILRKKEEEGHPRAAAARQVLGQEARRVLEGTEGVAKGKEKVKTTNLRNQKEGLREESIGDGPEADEAVPVSLSRAVTTSKE